MFLLHEQQKHNIVSVRGNIVSNLPESYSVSCSLLIVIVAAAASLTEFVKKLCHSHRLKISTWLWNTLNIIRTIAIPPLWD